MTLDKAVNSLPAKFEMFDLNDEPHPDYASWHNFLRKNTELRDEHEGVFYFGISNCNYVVFPSGFFIQNFGHNGKYVMAQVREAGVTKTEDKYRAERDDIRALLTPTMQYRPNRELATDVLIPKRPKREVIMLPDSDMGEFTYSEWEGRVKRVKAEKAHWSESRKEMVPAEPAHWVVFLAGVDKAWRELKIPLKRGRSMNVAITLACDYYKSPLLVTRYKHGYYGKVEQYKEPECCSPADNVSRCATCGQLTEVPPRHEWPKDFVPQGPDHVPPGFCSGICGPKGPAGPQGSCK